MTLQENKNTDFDLRPRISVIGVGGAGGNAVNNMIRAKLGGVEFLVANTDAQAMAQSLVDKEKRIQLGLNITRGLGAGSKPDVGRAAAEESIDEVLEHMRGSNMVFITAGMGGGTGTGAAPVIARAARESGILTVGVVTKPFQFEGSHRIRSADRGIDELQQYVDTLIIIPNQNLFRIANEHTTFADAFKMADDVLYSGVRGVTDLMMMPGLINLDFADIRSIMCEMGKAMMGTGEAEGDRRALDAAEAAISNPLLDDVSMKGARGVLINITGGYDMTLYEVDEAANRIREDVETEANIIFGSTFDETINGRIRVSVVATGIDQEARNLSHHGADLENPLKNSSYKNSLQGEGMFSLRKTEEKETDRKETLDTNFGKELLEEEIINTNPFTSTVTDQTTFSENLRVVASDHNQGGKENAKIEQKRKTPSLFERFTGVGKNRYSQEARIEQDKKDADHKEEKEVGIDIPAFLRRGNN